MACDCSGDTRVGDADGDLAIVKPDYYRKKSMQPFDIIDAYDLDFYQGNALKYLLRNGTKPGVPKYQDMIKSREYMDQVVACTDKE